MRHNADRTGRNRGQWIVIGFMAFVIIVISICTVIFRSYVREFHKVTDKEKYDQYYVMITEDRKSDFWQSVYRGAYERGQEENVYVDLLGEHLSQEYSREDLMRIAMTSGVDGIFVESDESDEMLQMIDEAVRTGGFLWLPCMVTTHIVKDAALSVSEAINLGREYGRQVLKLTSDTEKSGCIGCCSTGQCPCLKFGTKYCMLRNSGCPGAGKTAGTGNRTVIGHGG